MEQKRIMILGVGEAQLNLISEAKKLGYYIVICDMRAESEGAKLADSFYAVNYMDRDAILEAAKKEHIDGVISNSEAAMLNVAWLSEQLHLPGNPEESIDILLSKSRFRDLQRKAGVYAPEHFVSDSADEIVAFAKTMRYPVIVKPSESSGTRGTTRIDAFDADAIRKAFAECQEWSRENQVAIEEYVVMSSLRVNDIELFVQDGEILWDGWFWQDRAEDAPMLPRTEIYPMGLADTEREKIRDTVEKIMRAAKICHGEYNAETYFTTEGEVFVIEINPRQAGNHIPQLVEEHTGINLTKLLVSTAVGDLSYYNELKTYPRQCNYITMQIVFSKQAGVFRELYIDPEIKPFVKWIIPEAKPGDRVVRGRNAAEAVAFVDLQFDSYETQHRFTDDIEKYIRAVVTEETVQP